MTHSSVLAWRNPRDGGVWWAAIYGVTQSRTQLKRLSSSSRLTCPSLSPQHLLKLMSLESIMSSNHVLLSSPCPQSFPASSKVLLVPPILSVSYILPTNSIYVYASLYLYVSSCYSYKRDYIVYVLYLVI